MLPSVTIAERRIKDKSKIELDYIPATEELIKEVVEVIKTIKDA